MTIGSPDNGAEQLRATRAAYETLLERYNKATTLLVTVNEQNKNLRDELTRKSEQSKKQLDDLQQAKANALELEQERDSLAARLREQVALVRVLGRRI